MKCFFSLLINCHRVSCKENHEIVLMYHQILRTSTVRNVRSNQLQLVCCFWSSKQNRRTLYLIFSAKTGVTVVQCPARNWWSSNQKHADILDIVAVSCK